MLFLSEIQTLILGQDQPNGFHQLQFGIGNAFTFWRVELNVPDCSYQTADDDRDVG